MKRFQIDKQPLQILLNALAVLVLIVSIQTAYAREEGGGSGSHGGDICEQEIKKIRNDLKKWISEANWNSAVGENLHFQYGVTVKSYLKEMMPLLEEHQVDISCSEPTEKNPYPVAIDGVGKICINEAATGGKLAKITCDSRQFMTNPNKSEEFGERKRYKLIHHEFASMNSVIEKSVGSDSDYFVSDQIEKYVQPHTEYGLSFIRNAHGYVPSICEQAYVAVRNGDGKHDRTYLLYAALGTVSAVLTIANPFGPWGALPWFVPIYVHRQTLHRIGHFGDFIHAARTENLDFFNNKKICDTLFKQPLCRALGRIRKFAPKASLQDIIDATIRADDSNVLCFKEDGRFGLKKTVYSFTNAILSKLPGSKFDPVDLSNESNIENKSESGTEEAFE